MMLFWILSFGLAWAITLPPAMAKAGVISSSPIPFGFGILIGLAPVAAATVATLRDGRVRAYWRSLGRLPRPTWTAAIALLLPPVLLVATYLASLASGNPIALQLDTDLLTFALLWLVLAFGEEAGWRGFALPRLIERHGFWSGSLVLGVVWCVWHYPKLLGSPYLGPLSETLPLIGLFSLQILFANFIICWIYVQSGRSVLAATLFHTSFNVVATAYFMAATDLVITSFLMLIVGALFLASRSWKAPVATPASASGAEA